MTEVNFHPSFQAKIKIANANTLNALRSDLSKYTNKALIENILDNFEKFMPHDEVILSVVPKNYGEHAYRFTNPKNNARIEKEYFLEGLKYLRECAQDFWEKDLLQHSIFKGF